MNEFMANRKAGQAKAERLRLPFYVANGQTIELKPGDGPAQLPDGPWSNTVPRFGRPATTVEITMWERL